MKEQIDEVLVTQDLDTIFNPANQIGKVFNVFGTYNIASAGSQLIDIDRLPTKTVKFMGKDVEIPDVMTLTNESDSDNYAGVAETRDEFQDTFSVHTNLETDIGAFNGQFEASYFMESKKSSLYKYAFRNSHIIMGTLTLDDSGPEVLRPTVKKRIDELPAELTDENFSEYTDFFRDFGTHFIYKVSLGACLEFYVSVETSSDIGTQHVATCMDLHYGGLFFSGDFHIDADKKATWDKYKSSSRMHIVTSGGDPTIGIKLANISPFVPDVALYDKWVDSIDEMPTSTNIKIKGIWHFCADNRKKALSIHEAFLRYAKDFRVPVSIKNYDTNTVLTVGGNFIPEPVKPIKPKTNFGYQGYRLTVLDRKDLSTVAFDKYFGYDAGYWKDTYEQMYNDMANAMISGGFYNDKYIAFMTTYGGMVTIAAPTTLAYGMMLACGAGEILRNIEGYKKASGSPYHMVRYSMAGVVKGGENSGMEGCTANYPRPGLGKLPDDLNFSVILYKSSINGLYSLGVDDFDEMASMSSAQIPEAFAVTADDSPEE